MSTAVAPHPAAGLRRLAGLLLLGAALLFVLGHLAQTRYPHPAWGYLNAFAEAAMVGAIADWFAVTALFRRPLGLPIPHTAIIPRNQARIGRRLAEFIVRHFLSTPQVMARLRGTTLAARLARWLRQTDNADAVAQRLAALARFALQALGDVRVQAFIEARGLRRLRELELAPVLGRLLQLLIRQGRHQLLLDEVLVRLDALLREPEARQWAARAVASQLRTLSRLGLQDQVGGWSANKIVNGMLALLAEVSRDPEHPLRLHIEAQLEEYARRLQEDPHWQWQARRLLDQVLRHPASRAYLRELGDELRQQLDQDLAADDSRIRQRLRGLVQRLGQALENDAAIRDWLDERVLELAPRLLENYSQRIGDYIAERVAGWETADLLEQMERGVGRDLQFIRINGTLVGGLVGLLLHALGQLAAAL